MVWANLGRNVRRSLGFVIIILSTLILSWSLWQAPENIRLVMLPEIASQSGDDESPTILDARQLRILWPAKMPIGSVRQILVVLKPVNRAGFELNQQFSDDIQSRMVEARLEIPGIPVTPGGSVQQSLEVAGPLEFHWNIEPVRSGAYLGTLWLHLVDSSSQPGTAEERQLLSAQTLEIRAVSFWGLNTYLAQVIGIIGIISGVVLSLDVFTATVRRLFRKA